MRILGIDPGLASLGFGLVQVERGKFQHLSHGVISTKAVTAMADRLLDIHQKIDALIAEWQPDVAAMEDLFFARNVSSALPVAESRGVIRLTMRLRDVELHEYKPNQIKLAVAGTARADKADVQAMVKILLKLAAIPKPDHAADALAIAVCHYNYSSSPLHKIPS